MQPQVVARLDNIAKIFGSRIIFKNVSLELHSGEIALLAGPNGAGKSTLLKILAGLSSPDSGNVAIQCQSAYLGHHTFLYPALTAIENLRFHASLGGQTPDAQKMVSALETVGLAAHALEVTRFFSRGMAQRLSFARVLLSDAGLLLLDEPFTGLDAAARDMMRQELLNFRRRGAAILFVSHSPETDAVFSDVVLTLANGEIGVAGAPVPCRNAGMERAC